MSATENTSAVATATGAENPGAEGREQSAGASNGGTAGGLVAAGPFAVVGHRPGSVAYVLAFDGRNMVRVEMPPRSLAYFAAEAVLALAADLPR